MVDWKEAGSNAPCPMPHAPCNLSVVIITRNTKDLLRNLLKSIEADNSLKPFLREVIIIDNFSTDGSNTMVHKEFPWVFLVKNDRNKGFAAAANIGITCAEGDYIFFLNSDTMLIEGEVATMVQFMEENPDAGICGPQLVYEDMRPQRSYAHIPSLLFEIFPRSLLELPFPARYSTKHIPKEKVAFASRRTPNSELHSMWLLMFPPLLAQRLLYGENFSMTSVVLMNAFSSFSKRLICVSGPGKLGPVLFSYLT